MADAELEPRRGLRRRDPPMAEVAVRAMEFPSPPSVIDLLSSGRKRSTKDDSQFREHQTVRHLIPRSVLGCEPWRLFSSFWPGSMCGVTALFIVTENRRSQETFAWMLLFPELPGHRRSHLHPVRVRSAGVQRGANLSGRISQIGWADTVPLLPQYERALALYLNARITKQRMAPRARSRCRCIW